MPKDPTRKQSSKNLRNQIKFCLYFAFKSITIHLKLTQSFQFMISSLAMETRNAIFKDAVLSLQIAFPDVKESNLTNDVLKNLPSHFDAFGAKTFKERTTNMNVQKRDLDTACHGFPLHLPGHVQPCRDEEKIECNEKDEKIRRCVALYRKRFLLGNKI